MRSEFRFPKATVALMTLILAGVLVAIDKARAIQASGPYANPHVGPILSVRFAILPSLVFTLLGACAAGGIGWTVLFALHRSGVQRLSEVDPSGEQGAGTKSSI